VHPPWLKAVVEEMGVSRAPVDDALATFARL
jgi:hypothetical protein